ncbi:hypothetical protein CPB86DRAFT_809058 [Serendipita vermifera]|nr:hypothetical protein CPB86DRAFT_809058 [Serendipita vermifera]
MNEMKIGKRDLNRLVLDYLLIEGYQTAAQSFVEEAASDLPLDAARLVEDANIDVRNQIRDAIEGGDVQTAIELCNDLDPEILDSHPHLHFHLLTQSLIELIRQGKTVEALDFAKVELAPRAERNEEFLKELEAVMCLLVYGANLGPASGKDKGKASAAASDKASLDINAPPAIKNLLSMQHRAMTASELNSALLSSLSLGGRRGEPRLAGLIRLCAWGEDILDKNGVSFPRLEVKQGIGSKLEATRADAQTE